jgi:hypothetical protein
MGRGAVIVGVVALVIGLSAGYLWWGAPTGRMQAELNDARSRVEALQQEIAGRPREGTPEELQALRARVKALEEDLAQERVLRSRLEAIVSAGKK